MKKLTTITVKPGSDEVILQIEGEAGEQESITSTEITIRDYETLISLIKRINDKKITIVCATNHPLCVKKIENLIEQWIWRDAKEVNALGKVILSQFICRAFTINYSRLARMFKEEHHMSIEAFYILRQTLAAERLLDENELSIVQISEALNFCSEQCFGENFKKNNGLTPLKYRKRFKN